VADLEQMKGRALSDAERADVAATVAPTSNRVDWAKELLSAKHPSSVADVPDTPTGSDVEDEVEGRLMGNERSRRLQDWLDVVAVQDPRLVEDLCAWRNSSTDTNRALPARLARRIRSFAPMLAGLVAEDLT
jgi:hypothetical protein